MADPGPPGSRGFASLLAIFALLFVALAAVAVARLAAADALRTRDADADAQCRQLLLAALDALPDPPPTPPSGLTLTAEPTPGGESGWLLTASTGHRTWHAEARLAEGQLTATTLRLSE